MEILGNGFGLLATVFGVVGLLGGAAGYFKASRGDSIIKYQTIEISALRRSLEDKDKDKTRLEAEKMAAETASVTKDETITELQKHNKYLQKLGQGSPQLKKLTAAVENQTKLISQLIAREGSK